MNAPIAGIINMPAIGRLTRGGPQVAQQSSDHPIQEDVEQGEEEQADGPHHQKEAIHQSDAPPATSTTITVSPTSSRSPTPSTTSLTATSLTRDPFVLPRSA